MFFYTKGLFPGFTVVALQETLLGGNQYKSEFNRLPWNVDSMEHSAKNYAVNGVYDDKVRYSAIQLKPMEIRTFVMELGRV